LEVTGQADFLSEPHPAIEAELALSEVPLEPFRSILERANLQLRGGLLTASGRLEYAPGAKSVRVHEATIQQLKADYVHRPQTGRLERRGAERVKEVARRAAEEPRTKAHVEELTLTESELGWWDLTKEPPYRLYIAAAEFHLKDFSTEPAEEPAVAKLTGRFMGSGETTANVRFRPWAGSVDLDLDLQIVGTELRSMNDLLRAYAGLDVAAGAFSLFSEVNIHRERIRGYVKPLLRGLNVYDPEQERGEGVLQKAKEGLAGALGQALKNPRNEVATVADLSGPVQDPEASTWQVLGNVLRNAFFEAILPGFQREAGRPARDE
jgi:hypothetical protein